jgi:hypothetical protein
LISHLSTLYTYTEHSLRPHKLNFQFNMRIIFTKNDLPHLFCDGFVFDIPTYRH